MPLPPLSMTFMIAVNDDQVCRLEIRIFSLNYKKARFELEFINLITLMLQRSVRMHACLLAYAHSCIETNSA